MTFALAKLALLLPSITLLAGCPTLKPSIELKALFAIY
jgi:hypothetical protein